MRRLVEPQLDVAHITVSVRLMIIDFDGPSPEFGLDRRVAITYYSQSRTLCPTKHPLLYRLLFSMPPRFESDPWRKPYSPTNVPRIEQSRDNQLEGPSIPQIAGQKPKTNAQATMNNTGTFHDSNLSHVNQGDYGTFTQGNSYHNTFNVRGGMVQHVNEGGLSGAVLHVRST
jgi:hypothetical protein